MSRPLPCLRAILGAGALLAAGGVHAFSLDWTQIGHPGNAADALTGFGAVPYTFSLATHDLTWAQYAEFLNAADPSAANALRLWSPAMADATWGGLVLEPAAPAGARYRVMTGRGLRPVTNLSYYAALRLANWLHNGQGSGSTEGGAYTLGPLGPDALPLQPPATHEPGARFWVPTENEWYKAAYHGNADASAGGYFKYPTGTGSAPVASAPNALFDHANFSGNGYVPATSSDVGAYAGTASRYGVRDLGGNVYQWTEAVIAAGRGIRGGSYANGIDDLLATTRFQADPASAQFRNLGLRLASSQPGSVTVPPPLAQLTVKGAGRKGTTTSADGLIACGSTCTAQVPAGLVMTLTARPQAGYTFVNWSGACSGVTPVCTLPVTGKPRVQANFIAQ